MENSDTLKPLDPQAAWAVLRSGLENGTLKLSGSHSTPSGAKQAAEADAAYVLTLLARLQGLKAP